MMKNSNIRPASKRISPYRIEDVKKVPGSVYKEVVEKGLLVYKKGCDIQWQ